MIFGAPPYHSQLFAVLSVQSCRYLIYYFLSLPKDTIGVDDLGNGIQLIATHGENHQMLADEHNLESLLLEHTIPLLERFGLLEYDSRNHVVKYHSTDRRSVRETYRSGRALRRVHSCYETIMSYDTLVRISVRIYPRTGSP